MINQANTGRTNYFAYDQYGDNPMTPIGPVGIVPMAGSEEFCKKVNEHFVARRLAYSSEEDLELPGFLRDDYRLKVHCNRFPTGEGKALFEDSVRGHDLFILTDVMNFSVTYDFYGKQKPMSPDEHFQDLKRIILAASGKSRRINIIMPFLYESRQHRRSSRESLDCAFMLEELDNLGVANIITFDVHDPRVANSTPISGFESIPLTYQMLKAMVNHIPDLDLNSDKLMIISPDEGAINRVMYFSSMLKAPLGTFYKRRDFTQVIDGRNPILAHEFLGDDVEGKDVLIIDDMISSGDSMLDIAREMKERRARRVFCTVSFALFTSGLDRFNKAYEEGIIDGVLGSNLTYRTPELLAAPWFIDVDCSKFVALIVDAINHDSSLSNLVDQTQKINRLLKRNAIGNGGQDEPNAD